MSHAYERNIKIIYGKTKCGECVLPDNGCCSMGVESTRERTQAVVKYKIVDRANIKMQSRKTMANFQVNSQ